MLILLAGMAPMGKAKGIEAKLARLALVRNEPPSPAVTQELRSALADASNFVVAEAARAITQENGAGLSADLVAAFERFLIEPIKTDKLCVAKIAILDALNRIDYMDSTIFRDNIDYVQDEPAYPESVDRGADVRSACAFGLVRTDTMGSLPLLADLLVDKEKTVRVAAAMALAGTTQTAAVPLLRLAARFGDKPRHGKRGPESEEPEVMSACFNSLLIFGWQEAIPFIAEFLGSRFDDICTMACLALGESRRPEALEHLTRFWRHCPSRVRADVLIAISLLRLPEATAFLLGLITKPLEVAGLAVEALAVQCHNPQVREQTEAAVNGTGDSELRKLFHSKFDRK